MFLSGVATFGILFLVLSVAVLQSVRAQGYSGKDFVAPTVFQAAGPTISSIQGSVDQFRAALGAKREINWDGNGSSATATFSTPFAGFLVSRGALFTTPGTSFVQAPLSGLASTFGNGSYETIFQAFSPLRLFSAIGSNVTDTQFFVPGGGNIPATTTGFGAVLTDVDQPDGSGPGAKQGNRGSSSLFEYFGVNGELLFSSFVPAAPGNGSLSFFGVVFNDARIARVRITSGNSAPGPDDEGKSDIVMMDDFIFGDPQTIQ
jgi:hypothetical protein